MRERAAAFSKGRKTMKKLVMSLLALGLAAPCFADVTLKLTDATGAIVYIDIDCGIGTTIAANTKGHYHFGALAVAIEATAMKLEITGASGNIPNAGVVEVYILHRVTNDLASV